MKPLQSILLNIFTVVYIRLGGCQMTKDNCNFVDKQYISDQIDEMIFNLQKLRIQKGVSQYKLAKMTGLSHTTIMRIEHFISTPSLEALLKIAYALEAQVTLSEIANQNEKAIIDTQTSSLTTDISKDEQKDDVVMLHLSDIHFGTSDKFEKSFRSFRFLVPSFDISPQYYLDEVNSTLKEYTNSIKSYVHDTTLFNNNQGFYKNMSLVLREYYLGQHESAYNLFADTLNKIDISYMYSSLSTNQTFYKARKIINNHIKFKPEDFYHIPFEKRFLVSTQRYSFPGLPCLYMGTSPEVCLQEINCTMEDAAIAEIHAHNAKSIRILDLTKIFQKSPEHMTIEEWEHFYELFPLIYLCSTKIRTQDLESNTKISFRPDYIIPQLLLEFILDKSIWDKTPILGVQYYSVKEDFVGKWLAGKIQDLAPKINLAIPAHTENNSGYCQTLRELFSINLME